MKPESLLIVDDDETVCRVLSVMLTERGYRVVTELDAGKVIGLLREGDFDAALLDLVMPELDGFELIARIREHWSALPIVVVTAYGIPEAAVAAMRHGATDFVTKPVDPSLLDLRIRRAFDLEHARRLADTDGLTGLYNHRYLQERLPEEIERAQRYQHPLSIAMADLDHFKTYNDTHGHIRGDEALIAVSRVLRQVSRSTDVVARYGGDELVLILPETPAGEARVVAERARRGVEALALGEGNGTPVTISLGVAAHSPGGSKQELIERADATLYRAKRQGRNHVSMAVGAQRSRGRNRF